VGKRSLGILLDVGRRIILKLILEEEDGVVCTGLVWLWIGTSVGIL
jgi:hypothetical protein